MNRSNTQLLKRLLAIAAAAVVLLLVIIGGGSISDRGQEIARPLATIAAAGDIEVVLDEGTNDGAAAGGEQERRSTPTPRPRRTSAATPTRAGPQEFDGLPVIYVDQLPREGQETLRLIEEGGPFPYSRDGLIFQNREGILPSRPRGYYREFTVITPGEDDRGARRIVAGEGGELYYTDDHYDSFSRIMERRT
jgi:ribonuclease T1